jgi:hypothetical protein
MVDPRIHARTDRFLAALLATALVAIPLPARAGPADAGSDDTAADAEPEGDSPAGEEGAEGEPAEPAPEPEPEPEPEPPSDREKAADLFRQGTKAYEVGDYPTAIEKFEEAFDLAPEPALLFNMGQAQWRWFKIDNDIEHLRKARLLFENYDKRMQGQENYYPEETQAFIAALESLIEAEERKLAEANRAIIQGPSIDDLEELERRRVRREKNLRTAKALNASGITFIVLGSIGLGVGLGGLIARSTYKFILDESSGNDDPNQPVPVSADEDARRRDGYSAAGVAAFAGFVAGGIMLPVGIGLKVGGGVIERRELGKVEKKPKDSKPRQDGPSVAPENITPAAAAPQRRTGKIVRKHTHVYAQPGALLTIQF